ncbi:MAG TPA: NADH-quinone oxidoreductase subunit L [Vicinamibacteria bacterium]|nr:NADH-quinone oxidoreductase subunit L [Vicinamibacteria bacterium]
MTQATPLDGALPFAILLLPLAGFVVLSLFGEWIRRDKEDSGAAWLACGTVLAAFLLAVWTARRLFALPAGPEGLHLFTSTLSWPPFGALDREPLDFISVGSLRVPFKLLVDPLSCVMTLVVTGIGSLIHVYSVGYMAHDEGKVRFFSYLNLFTFFMLLLVLGGSLPLLFVGWEGVGLCSYLLIGFWYTKDRASAAGLKAFVVNRVGDVGLILGMAFIFHVLGTLDLVDLADNASGLARERLWQFGPATIAALLLFLGATGKSAQIPLQVWLPDAMEGPTPVSALIHAATMVTAGVYLVARLGPLYQASATALMVVAVVGTLTALLAGTIAIVQTDIKRVLAYSTVSQLGFMFLAAGAGAFGVAVFHLYTHAFFKALLFLGAGSVIHAVSGEQDMRQMGGLRTKIPWTFWTFAAGTLAISGVPLFAGFYSKDEILAAAFTSGHTLLFWVALFTALLTAAYMGRLVILTFFGGFRGEQEAEPHLHESPWSMLGPLVVLAVGSVVAGYPLFRGTHGRVQLPAVLQPAFRGAEHEAAGPGWLMVLAILSALGGLLIAWYLYVSMPELRARLRSPLRPLLHLFAAKYHFDDVYDAFVRRVVVEGSERVLWQRVDARGIDGIVNGTARLTGRLSEYLRPMETGFVRHYALVLLAGAVAVLSFLLWS